MSQAGGPGGDRIAEVSVGINVDTSGLKAGMAQAEQAVTSSAQKMNAATETTNNQFRALNSGIKGVVGGFYGFVSIVTRTIGVIGLLAGGLTALAAAFAHPIRKANEMREAFLALRRATEEAFADMASDAKATGDPLEEAFKKADDAAAEAIATARKLRRNNDITKEQYRALIDTVEELRQAERKRAFEAEAARKNFEASSKKDDEERARRLKQHEEQGAIRNEFRELRSRQAHEAAENAASRQEDRMRGLGQQFKSIRDRNPFVAIDNAIKDAGKNIDAAISGAGSPVEASMAAMFGAAIIKGLQDQRKAMEREFRDAIASGINAALQQQAGAAGVQGTTVLLRDIGLQVGSIRNSIPREYTGPIQGVPGGMGGN